MESYRIIRIDYSSDVTYNQDYWRGFFPHENVTFVTFYAVQVRGLLWWHTVKIFRKIRRAAELLHKLREESE